MEEIFSPPVLVRASSGVLALSQGQGTGSHRGHEKLRQHVLGHQGHETQGDAIVSVQNKPARGRTRVEAESRHHRFLHPVLVDLRGVEPR